MSLDSHSSPLAFAKARYTSDFSFSITVSDASSKVTIMLPCYHVSMLPCYHYVIIATIMLSLLPQCYHCYQCYHYYHYVTMLPCFHVTMLPLCYHCYHNVIIVTSVTIVTIMLPCYHYVIIVTMVTMLCYQFYHYYHCYHVTMLPSFARIFNPSFFITDRTKKSNICVFYDQTSL